MRFATVLALLITAVIGLSESSFGTDARQIRSAPACCVLTKHVWDCSACEWIDDAKSDKINNNDHRAFFARQDATTTETASAAAATSSTVAPGPLTLYPPKTSGARVDCGAVYIHNYDMGLHIASVFIILVTSAIGVMFPIVAGWWSHLHGRESNLQLDAASFGKEFGFWPSVFFLFRHFGTGIIFSTTFIHLLDEGFAMFHDGCIGTLHFNATAPAIALAAAFITFYLDFIGNRAAIRSAAKMEAAHSHEDDGSDDVGSAEAGKTVTTTTADSSTRVIHDCSHADALFREQQAWQVVLLEAGIIFHSVMVGVTLGAGSGTGWTTLMIVIVFHQIFEGAALGARIAALHWLSRTRAFLYGFAFTIVTPLSMALGIGIRASFSQNGRTALLAVGILDSLSAGILLYTAFKLLNNDFIDGPLRDAPASRVCLASAMMFLGCFLMSLLGKWA